MIFQDRKDAGQQLAAKLEKYKGTDSIIFGIPRGGVVIAYEVAKILSLPMDVIIPRKIGAPAQPELAIGAIGDDVCVLDDKALKYLHVSDAYIREESERQKKEIERRWRLYRGDKRFPDLTERTAIVVDDGVATGYTTMAAVRALRNKKPEKLVLAIPIGPEESLARLRPEVDELIVIDTPEPFFSVGSWYQVFDQTSDQEVIDLLRKAEGHTAKV